MSDDEPLYDSVASDEDYAALAPINLDVTEDSFRLSSVMPRAGETVSSSYNASLPADLADTRRTHSPSTLAHSAKPGTNEIETLKKEIHTKDSTITELKNQLKNLQTIVEQLTKENSVLKTTSSVDDDQSMTSQMSINDSTCNVLEGSKAQERGKSLETEPLSRSEEVDGKLSMKSAQRPVSMYETREGPKNNWQVTKHQLTTLGSVERSLPTAGEGSPLPSGELVQRRAEGVTRAISELWAAARDQHPRLQPRGDAIRHAVRALLALFPQTTSDRELNLVLGELRAACSEVSLACSAPSPLNDVRAAAYDLAKATKLLVTHFPPHS
uniref:ARF GTPase-activating protein GIT1 C-terminal domain-containing protein n=1 Tax=Heliothis virescens TaxID=7102 RepID=A0A2A4J3E3_HELVI